MIPTNYAKKSWNNAKKKWVDVNLEPPKIYPKESQEGLGDQIAGIDMETKKIFVDEANLEQKIGLDKLEAVESHEVGHHKMCPYDLNGFVKLVAHAYKEIPNLEKAKEVENIFADALINAHLYKNGEKKIIDIYKKFSENNGSKFWSFYMNTFEQMLNIPGQILKETPQEEMRKDATKMADIMKKAMYNADNWPRTIRDFARCAKKYIADDKRAEKRAQKEQQSEANNQANQNNPQAGKGNPQNNGELTPNKSGNTTMKVPVKHKKKKNTQHRQT